ncbi:hypothetical protein PRIPAC_83081 [Pristionchus pacificus]|uniref:phosphogluconate dehydrogenase (NADP(+)-dependent, decarboxylating) n=1 Tax=Pristionchus pacificus TaxID=54126 RepID=A0A454Y0E2_PRIPA|nr:hypothetical protein PRIPAC_83081 [Pristionchus pacificus]|eukprot:PDM80343.1 hypothetical protein PRIPAC_32922 [Pristionchus pacificus]
MDEWNKGELDSFLIEITANILRFKDEKDETLLPKIRDAAGQKGKGKWICFASLEYGTPVTLIGEAVFVRCLSVLKGERVRASKELPQSDVDPSNNLKYGAIDLMWRGGCIIRSRFLGDMKKAFDSNPNLANLLLDNFFKDAVAKAHVRFILCSMLNRDDCYI